MSRCEVTVTVHIDPQGYRTLKDLGIVCKTLAEVVDDMPWRDDAKHAVKAARRLMRRVRMEQK